MTEELKALVNYRLEQAGEAILEVEALLAKGLLRGCVNRAYYAMFYAVLALLATKELGTSKHSAAIALFDREFIRQGSLSKDLSKWFHEAFQKRLKSDYGAMVEVSAEDARRLLKHAQDFVSTVRAHLQSLV